MHAMILAAGRGERMRPLTDATPKPLLLVGGKPLISWHITRLAQAGFTQIVINHAWLGEQIEAMLGNGAAYGVQITYSPECEGGWETAGGIATALPLLGDAPFLVVSGDIFTDYPFQQLKQQGLASDCLAHLIMVDNPSHHPEGDWGIEEDLASQTHIPSYTFSGIGLYHPAFFATTPAYQRTALRPLFAAGMQARKISAEYYAGLWCDVGTIVRLEEANAIALRSFAG